MNVQQSFKAAVLGGVTDNYRLHVKLPNEKVGLTAWYTKAEIGNVQKEVERQPGHSIIKIEHKRF